MLRMSFLTAGLCLLLSMFLVTGCLNDPEKKEAPVEEEPEFRDLTSKEDVINNLVLSYAERNISEYSKLLLRNDDSYNGSDYQFSYYWYNQPEDEELEAYLMRDEDIMATNNLFLAAQGTPAKLDHEILDDLTLEIGAGSWVAVSELFGEPCEDCWSTIREYLISVSYGENRLSGDDVIQIYIVPVDEGDKTIYKIALAKDIYVE